MIKDLMVTKISGAQLSFQICMVPAYPDVINFIFIVQAKYKNVVALET
jgi:hypothetical protein